MDRPQRFLLFTLAAITILAGAILCGMSGGNTTAGRDILYQVSTIDALQRGKPYRASPMIRSFSTLNSSSVRKPASFR